MEQISNELRVGWADPAIDALLGAIGPSAGDFSRHFAEGEDFFIRLTRSFEVPRLPFHHDVRRPLPEEGYRASLHRLIAQIAELAPQVLRGLSYFFDPAEALKPCFFQVHEVGDRRYLYFLRLDLMPKPTGVEILERSTNDFTARYLTRNLFLEPVLIPLEKVVPAGGRVGALRIRQAVSQTWIGEYGRGYFQQGIWMDLDLTKFFSRLFLPAGLRAYPYYPYLCRYKTVCRALLGLSVEARRDAVPWLHRVLAFLMPAMEGIQDAMRTAAFSEDLPLFISLKAAVPTAWYEPWRSLRVEAYLTDDGRREFRIDD